MEGMTRNYMEILRQFSISGTVTETKPFGNGIINDTIRVNTAEEETPDYILQRINHHVFKDVELLMNNIIAVTNHIRNKLIERGIEDVDKHVLHFIPTHEGTYYYYDSSSYWRVMLLIPEAYSYDIVNAKYARFAGLSFGDFQDMLSDIPETLGEVIPNFHNMEYRLEELREAVKKDPVGRVSKVQPLLDAIEQRAETMCQGERLHREGLLPKRVCHCDTKVNNILFDEQGEVLCVIDLDTVMPNFIFSDYGDFLRTAANTAAEDEPDLNKIAFNIEIFEAFTEGYLQKARFLTDIEIDHLPFAATLFPYMQAVRFLGDYINGDTYYKIAYPEHNLVRTKAQLRLLDCIEEKLPFMQSFVAAQQKNSLECRA